MGSRWGLMGGENRDHNDDSDHPARGLFWVPVILIALIGIIAIAKVVASVL